MDENSKVNRAHAMLLLECVTFWKDLARNVRTIKGTVRACGDVALKGANGLCCTSSKHC